MTWTAFFEKVLEYITVHFDDPGKIAACKKVILSIGSGSRRIETRGYFYFLNCIRSFIINLFPMLDIFFQVIDGFWIFTAAGPGGCDMAVWIRNALSLKCPEPPQLFARPFLRRLLITGIVINREAAEENVCDPVDPFLIKGLLADLADRDLIRIWEFDFSLAGQREAVLRVFFEKLACLRYLQPPGQGLSAEETGIAA